MSVSRECEFVEYKPKKWYLLLASREYGSISDADAGCWGPFSSEDETNKYLKDYFSNPGSLWIIRYGEKLSNIQKRLITKAEKPNWNWGY